MENGRFDHGLGYATKIEDRHVFTECLMLSVISRVIFREQDSGNESTTERWKMSSTHVALFDALFRETLWLRDVVLETRTNELQW